MTITIFGIIWLVILFVCLFLPFKYSFGVLILSSIFQSVSVVNFSNNGIYPMLITEAYIIIKFFLMRRGKEEIANEETKKLLKRLAIFLIVTTILSIISSKVFGNINIYNTRTKSYIDFGLDLSFVTRVVTLLCNIATIYVIYKSNNLLNNKFVVKCFVISITICIAFGFWEFICKKTGNLQYFPYELLYNNISYKQAYNQSLASGNVRMNSTFLEPSYLGSFLVASFFALLATNKHGRYNIILLLLLICLVLNLSGTGLATFIIMTLYYITIYKKFNLKKNQLFVIFFLPVMFLLILLPTGYMTRIINMIGHKFGSVSGVIRTSADITALKILKSTYLLGGGWSCFRGSSLLLTCLGEVGVIGCALLFLPVYDYIKKQYNENKGNLYYRFGYIYMIAVVISMVLAIPDITFMLFWTPLYYLASMNKNEYEKEQKNDC